MSIDFEEFTWIVIAFHGFSPKVPPRWANMTQHEPNMTPRWAQDDPRWAQDEPRWAHVTPRWAHMTPRRPPEWFLLVLEWFLYGFWVWHRPPDQFLLVLVWLLFVFWILHRPPYRNFLVLAMFLHGFLVLTNPTSEDPGATAEHYLPLGLPFCIFNIICCFGTNTQSSSPLRKLHCASRNLIISHHIKISL